jgi:hypothetical protein
MVDHHGIYFGSITDLAIYTNTLLKLANRTTSIKSSYITYIDALCTTRNREEGVSRR